MLLLVFLDWRYNLPWWIYPLLLLAYLLVLFYGSYFIQSGFFIKALYKGSPNRKAIAITFDDGPMQEFTPRLLDLLKAENVPAAFFLIGKNITGNQPLVKRMVNEGHVVGNHSYSHTYWFSLNNAATIQKDLKQCDDEIIKAIGKKPRFFRPPYGVTNPMVAKATIHGGYQCIGWSIRTYDTNATNAPALLQKALKNLSNGDIILFHDWGQHTIGILSDFIKEARSRGFQIIGLDELLGEKAYY
ncbi:MAG TPA: polysaccharide deacetylase family protein [Chitinophagales bacterium]|nr:polysaccharide deacetylase family protein [Chitinophagales bacterium]